MNNKQKIPAGEVLEYIDMYIENMDSVDMVELYNYMAGENKNTLDINWED